MCRRDPFVTPGVGGEYAKSIYKNEEHEKTMFSAAVNGAMNGMGVSGKMANTLLKKLNVASTDDLGSLIVKEYISGRTSLPVGIATEFGKSQIGSSSPSSQSLRTVANPVIPTRRK